jgi:son of sevenless-like protein
MLMTQSAIPAPFSRQQIADSRDGSVEPSFINRSSAQSTQGNGYQSTESDPTYSYTTSPSSRQNYSSRTAARQISPIVMNGFTASAPTAVMWVRALYDYEADDRTSLSFHEGDIIQVITQLESGWWDGVINGVRGWFPSNYCQVIASPEGAIAEKTLDITDEEEDLEDDEEYEDQFDDEDDGESDRDDISQLPIEGTTNSEKSRADFWIPQATPDGRLFYINTMTGESSSELPLESPSSAAETGPRDRMNVNVPEKTRPPPEMMAQGYTQDEDYESEGNSASEMDGESIMLASRNSLVGLLRPVHFLIPY